MDDVNKKRKIIITVIMALVVITAFMLLWNVNPKKNNVTTEVRVTLPDAQIEALPKAKIKAYEKEDKLQSRDRYMSEMALAQSAHDSVSAQAMAVHTQATQRLSRRINTSSSSNGEPERSHEVTTSAARSYSSANKDNWQERYDYLYEKIYGDLQQQQPQTETQHQPEQKPETIHVQAKQEDKSDDGFITITVGSSEQAKDGILKVATTSEQKIKAGDKVQLRLVADAILQDNQIARNTYIYAIAKIDNNRLQLTVSNINIPQGNIPCNLVAYDTDGYKGLSFSSDDSSQEINREIKSALQTTVGQLAAITNRTAGNIIRSTSRIGSNAIGNNKQQTITLPANYMIQLR